ncbi:MAG: hypothetical protein JO216_09255, partial [Hyphomicrobiales bacterium]|nr:hypothetical protein [Hyphomicrobiales bacterium]
MARPRLSGVNVEAQRLGMMAKPHDRRGDMKAAARPWDEEMGAEIEGPSHVPVLVEEVLEA